MQLHLNHTPAKINPQLDYGQNLLFIGSCFAENIGELMQRYKWQTLINPNGILYNPISIAQALQNIMANKHIQETDLFYANELWNNWNYHSHFSHPDKTSCINNINQSIDNAHRYLTKTNWLMITFGSAYAYRLSNNQQLVGNCHKIPQKNFDKVLLTIEEITTTYYSLLELLKQFNPELQIVFTVSPVRYLRDGLIENNHSKARLLEAVHQLVQQHTNAHYFPAYELIMDDLRDYRFYKTDMVHPNEQAISYVFDKLAHAWMNTDTLTAIHNIKSIIQAKEHRPFNANTKAHQQFKQQQLQTCIDLQKQFPFMDLKEEIMYFNS